MKPPSGKGKADSGEAGLALGQGELSTPPGEQTGSEFSKAIQQRHYCGQGYVPRRDAVTSCDLSLCV